MSIPEKKTIFLCFLIALSLFTNACSLKMPNVAELTLESLKNAEYHTIAQGTFRLTDGIYNIPPLLNESQEDWFIKLVEPIAFGDLNSDGINDAVVVLKMRTGGTGVFVEIAAVLNKNGKPVNVATTLLGDRKIVNSISIQSSEIIIEGLTQGPNDGLCCPSLLTTWKFNLVGNELVLPNNP